MRLEFPVVAKVVSGDLPHKSDVGGVQLSIRNASELQDAVRTIFDEREDRRAGRALEGVVVSEMVSDALEIIVGVINDDVFGPTVLLGFGGTLAEVLHDRSYRIAPFDDATARSHDWGAARRRFVRRHPRACSARRECAC